MRLFSGGGYIAGRSDIIDRARFHLGQDAGAPNHDSSTKQLLQGWFLPENDHRLYHTTQFAEFGRWL